MTLAGPAWAKTEQEPSRVFSCREALGPKRIESALQSKNELQSLFSPLVRTSLRQRRSASRTVTIVDRTAKREVGVLFIHGLWKDPVQWATNPGTAYMEAALEESANVMALHLAGHGNEWRNARQVTAATWLEQARASLRELSRRSERVIVVGQSTGGALALRLATDSETKQQVHGLVVIEPAFKVQDHLEWGTCALRRMYREQLDSIGIALGIIVADIPAPYERNARKSPHLGCMVADIVNEVVVPGGFDPLVVETTQLMERDQEIRNRRDALYASVSVPSLVLIAKEDGVISNHEARRFTRIQGQRSQLFESTRAGHNTTELDGESLRLTTDFIRRYTRATGVQRSTRVEDWKIRRYALTWIERSLRLLGAPLRDDASAKALDELERLNVCVQNEELARVVEMGRSGGDTTAMVRILASQMSADRKRLESERP